MRRLLPAALVAAALLAPAAEAHPHTPPVPGDIAVPAGNKAYLEAHAVGVQIYTCNGTAWTLVAPRANLYKGRKLIATHYAGPTWEARDGSTVVGARVNGVNVDPTAIDWLLLSATPTSDRGKLAHTTYIQRINTTGGRAPASGCSAETTGAHVEVPYTADYVFFKAHRGRHRS